MKRPTMLLGAVAMTIGAVACDATHEPHTSPDEAYRERSPQILVEVAQTAAPEPTFDVHRATLMAIGKEIEALGSQYPALERFDVDRHVNALELGIGYEHRVKRVVVARGVKRELVVQPEPDGLYLSIDFHADVEGNEARSQVFRGHYRNQGRRVTYVARPGRRTGDLGERLWKILVDHGTVDVGLR